MINIPPVTDQLAQELVAGANIAHLATVLPSGAPHSVPLWIGWEDTRLAFLTGPTSRKARNIARDPRVAVSITDRSNHLRMAMLRGRVVDVIDGADGWAIIDRLSTKYIGAPYPLREGRVAFLVEVDAVSSGAFG